MSLSVAGHSSSPVTDTERERLGPASSWRERLDTSDGAPTLTARIIGAVEVHAYDDLVPIVGSRRCCQLLTRILLNGGRTVSATRLGADLWPDLPPERARACVHTTVNRLRRFFRSRGIEALKSGPDAYGIADGVHTWIDLTAFRRLVAEAARHEVERQLGDAISAYERALALGRGDLLADEPSTDWIEAERRVFARELSGARSRLIELYLNAGRADPAALNALLGLRHDPTDERMSQLLIKSHLALGERRLALDEYWRLDRVLDRELGVAPTPETWALVRDIDRG
jgi:DNA-binding SARP family transcriptional activator